MSIPQTGEHRLEIPGPAGVLEAVLTVPPAVANATHFAVVCHPHPQQGGTMDNKVVSTLVRLFRDHGLPTIRFNFRGVGRSEGHFDLARGEIDDLEAVLRWAREELGAHDITLAGFSFGSYIAAAGSQRLPDLGQGLEHLILVAPPVHHYPFETLFIPFNAVVAMGDADEVVPPEAVFAWVESLNPPPILLRFAGCGHFFHGRLSDLKAELAPHL